MRVAIIGAGHIARKMAYTLGKMKNATAYGVGSRSLSKAKEFATEFKMEQYWGSYEELVADPKVDLVYVATPHSHHRDHIKLALNGGKPVLCEKSFTVNAQQAKEVISLAKEKNLLLAEAIWTRYVPMRGLLDELLDSQIIGRVYSLTANLGYLISGKERLSNPALAGGALLDVGVYPLNFALMTLRGKIEKIDSSVLFTNSGVDAQSSVTMIFEGQQMALLHSTQMGPTDRRGMIYGDKGYIEVVNINNPEKLRVFDLEHNLLKEVVQPEQITGFEYQVEACREALEKGKIETDRMPHSEIIRVMEIMDQLRSQWGLRYPME
ncbi:MAG: Gfo/Idh/MocA family oxidoreductase [Sphaerochaetaceae bacterium]